MLFQRHRIHHYVTHISRTVYLVFAIISITFFFFLLLSCDFFAVRTFTQKDFCRLAGAETLASTPNPVYSITYLRYIMTQCGPFSIHVKCILCQACKRLPALRWKLPNGWCGQLWPVRCVFCADSSSHAQSNPRETDDEKATETVWRFERINASDDGMVKCVSASGEPLGLGHD